MIINEVEWDNLTTQEKIDNMLDEQKEVLLSCTEVALSPLGFVIGLGIKLTDKQIKEFVSAYPEQFEHTLKLWKLKEDKK